MFHYIAVSFKERSCFPQRVFRRRARVGLSGSAYQNQNLGLHKRSDDIRCFELLGLTTLMKPIRCDLVQRKSCTRVGFGIGNRFSRLRFVTRGPRLRRHRQGRKERCMYQGQRDTLARQVESACEKTTTEGTSRDGEDKSGRAQDGGESVPPKGGRCRGERTTPKGWQRAETDFPNCHWFS